MTPLEERAKKVCNVVQLIIKRLGLKSHHDEIITKRHTVGQINQECKETYQVLGYFTIWADLAYCASVVITNWRPKV